MRTSMRVSTFAAVVAAAFCCTFASSARADSTVEAVGREALRLDLDPDLFADASRILGENTQASSTLPAVMDFVSNLNAASSSSGGGALSGVGIGLQVGTPTALTFKFGAGGNANIILGIGLGF